MPNDDFLARQMGDQPPLLAGGHKPPDKREISLRWLSGTFMTGITSSLLMGVALFGAMEGREQLAIPAEALASTDLAVGDNRVAFGIIDSVEGAIKGAPVQVQSFFLTQNSLFELIFQM